MLFLYLYGYIVEKLHKKFSLLLINLCNVYIWAYSGKVKVKVVDKRYTCTVTVLLSLYRRQSPTRYYFPPKKCETKVTD